MSTPKRYAVPYEVAATRTKPAGRGTLYVTADTPQDALTRAAALHQGTRRDPYARTQFRLGERDLARIRYGAPIDTQEDTVTERFRRAMQRQAAQDQANTAAWVRGRGDR